jgi:hypothetical protein
MSFKAAARRPFVKGSIETPAGPVPRVPSALALADRLGSLGARWGIGRLRYVVEPGLYALGKPGRRSPVLVTANYKLSFDSLRGALPGRDAWILVLDTRGINVWCAAGKGTFGTKELAGRIGSSGLAGVVSHRNLVLPQLSAPGVAAHQVRELTGFRVRYGPIRSADLPAFLDNGLRATQEMRTKSFTMMERAALIPMELIGALKTGLAAMLVLFLLSLWGSAGQGLARAAGIASYPAFAVLAAVVAGAVLTPLLLPWLPGRAFALKGACAGPAAFAVVASISGKLGSGAGVMEGIGLLLLVTAFSSYYAMYFTGASTFTSLSGVKKEMRWALPLQIGAGVSGFALWAASLFSAWG